MCMLSYCCYYLFLAIVIYLSTILYIICVMVNYFMFNLNAVHLHVALMVCFKVNFPLRTVKYYLKISCLKKERDNRESVLPLSP